MTVLDVTIPGDFASLGALIAYIEEQPSPWVRVSLGAGAHAGACFNASHCQALRITGCEDAVIVPGPEGYGIQATGIACDLADILFVGLNGGHDAISYLAARGTVARCRIEGEWAIGVEADEVAHIDLNQCYIYPASTGYGVAAKHGSSISQIGNMIVGHEQGGVRYGYGVQTRDNGMICGPQTTIQKVKVAVTADRGGAFMGDAGGTMRLYYCDTGIRGDGGNVTMPALTCNTIGTLVSMRGGHVALMSGLSASNIANRVVDAVGGEVFLQGACGRAGTTIHANRLREGALLHAAGTTFGGWPQLVDKDVHSHAFFT